MKNVNELKWRNIIGYSMYNFAGGTDMIAAIWLMYFYTTFCDISIAAVGGILTASRFITSLGSPIVGHVSDNFYKTALGRRFGRRKFFLLICIPLRAVLIPLIWLPGQTTWYYCLVNLVSPIVGLFYLLPAKALLAEMTRNSAEKIKMSSMTQLVANVVSVSVSAFPVVMFQLFGQNNIQSFLYMIWGYSAVATLSLVIFYLNVIERSVEEVGYSMTTTKAMTPVKWFKNMVADTASTLKIKAYRHYLGMFLAQTICRAISGSLHTYYVIFVLGLSTTVVSLISTLSYGCGFFFLGAFVALNKKIGGPGSYRVGGYIALTAFLLYLSVAFFSPQHALVLACVFACIVYCGKTGMVNATTYLASFIPDIDEAVTGIRREATFSGVDNFTDAIFGAAETMMIGAVLQLCGFVKGMHVQPQSAVYGLIALFTITPGICIIIGLFISHKCKFNLDDYCTLSQEVVRLRDGGNMAEAKPEAKKAFQDLTGFPYEQCWGNNDVLCNAKKCETNMAKLA